MSQRFNFRHVVVSCRIFRSTLLLSPRTQCVWSQRCFIVMNSISCFSELQLSIHPPHPAFSGQCDIRCRCFMQDISFNIVAGEYYEWDPFRATPRLTVTRDLLAAITVSKSAKHITSLRIFCKSFGGLNHDEIRALALLRQNARSLKTLTLSFVYRPKSSPLVKLLADWVEDGKCSLTRIRLALPEWIEETSQNDLEKLFSLPITGIHVGGHALKDRSLTGDAREVSALATAFARLPDTIEEFFLRYNTDPDVYTDDVRERACAMPCVYGSPIREPGPRFGPIRSAIELRFGALLFAKQCSRFMFHMSYEKGKQFARCPICKTQFHE